MPNLTEERVRAGHTGDGVRQMLGWSLAMSLAALLIALFALAH